MISMYQNSVWGHSMISIHHNNFIIVQGKATDKSKPIFACYLMGVNAALLKISKGLCEHD